jgi:thiol-disulfide isomerase/thioredoxin
MSQAPSALLLIATDCQHCPGVLQSLSELVKEAKLASLEVVNIVAAPERAVELNVRSVPWVKLGDFELLGMKSKTELEQWISKTSNPENMSDYFEELMTSGEIGKVQEMVEQQPEYIQSLLDIMSSDQSGLSARIGVGAVFEHISGSDALVNAIDTLGTYCQSPNARIRNDVCYYLGLSLHQDAQKYIQPLLDDKDSDVRECAADALEEIGD